MKRHGIEFRVRKIPRVRGAPALWVISVGGRRLDACVNRANVRKRVEQLARNLLRKGITCETTS